MPLPVSVALLLLAGLAAALAASYTPSSPLQLQIDHSLGGGAFERRASFSLSPPAQGFEKSKTFAIKEEGSGSNVISGAQVAQFKELLNKDGLYTIRVRLAPKDEEESEEYLYASIPAVRS